MNSPIYIVSDNHFSMKNDDLELSRRTKLFQVFEKIKKEFLLQKEKKCNVILGGDFFDYWFEYNNVIPSGYESILHALKELTSLGIQVHLVLGNHDYWDFGYLNKTTGLIIHKKNLTFMFNNEKILLTHGDGLLKKDYGYKVLKKIIRSRLFIFLFKLLPPNLTCRIATKISKSSSNYNHHDNNVNTIKHDIQHYAIKKWASGYDAILVGHYHQTGIINNKNKKIIYLGDWLSKFTVTALVEGEYWQGNWKEFLDF
tara:strand:- start:235 stop:1002 length:768 start_codon:yes stop_codon:yes gene_type:complete